MGKRVVCAGTFDHFHPGHVSFLLQAKMLGSELVVIIARDDNVERIKGIRPEHDELCRKANVERTGIADRVVLGHLSGDLFTILEELSPDVVALGYDQRVDEGRVKRRFPSCSVVRLDSYHPEKYKSSFYRFK